MTLDGYNEQTSLRGKKNDGVDLYWATAFLQIIFLYNSWLKAALFWKIRRLALLMTIDRMIILKYLLEILICTST